MQFPTLRTILISLAWVTIAWLSCVGTIYAINTIADGWRIGAGGGAAYSGIYGGFGAMIQNPGGTYYRARRTGGDIFVPTRSWGEWGAVTAAATPTLWLEIRQSYITWRSWYYNYDQWNGDHWDHHVEPYCNDETFGSWNYWASIDIWWCQNYEVNGNNWYPGNMWAYQGQGFDGNWHYH
jgi:hypothetical protein